MSKRIIRKSSITAKEKLNDLLSHTIKNDECLIWKGCFNTDGYARMGGNIKVHRLVMELSGQDIKDQVVRHLCNNPKCINPDHLVLGNHQENMDDRWAIGGYKRKVTPKKIRLVHALLETGRLKQKEIAEIVKLDARRVSDIKNLRYDDDGYFRGHHKEN